MIVIAKYALRYESTKIISRLTDDLLIFAMYLCICYVSAMYSRLSDMLEKFFLRIKTFVTYFILRAFL